MYISSDNSNWDTILPFITYAYNTLVQGTTGFSPFRLIYNRDPPPTLDTLFSPGLLAGASSDFLSDIRLRAEESRQIARWHTQQQQLQKGHYDATHKTGTIYSPDDLVWLWTPLRPNANLRNSHPSTSVPIESSLKPLL